MNPNRHDAFIRMWSRMVWVIGGLLILFSFAVLGTVIWGIGALAGKW